MIKARYTLTSLAGATAITFGAIGAVSADTLTSSSGNVGTSGIARSTFKQDKQDAVAEVLNTTTANLKTAHANKDLKQLISNAGLTKQTFIQKVKAEITSELGSQGYTQSQITTAIKHMHHHKR
jgi:hypothetical protein